MRVNAVIQARVGSSRLPGKVLRPLGERPVLDWVIRAAQRANGLDAVVVATTSNAADDPVADLAVSLGAELVRGSEQDVLGRYVEAVRAHPCDAVVRITADCPLLDPALITQVVAAWRTDPAWDYVSTTLQPTLPRGLDVELVRSAVLQALDGTAAGHDRVHVTSGVYAEPDRFALLGLVVAPAASDLRVTLDTAEDAAALDAIVSALGDAPPRWRDVVRHLRAHPEIVALNNTVPQKRLEEG